jgi:biotin carboxylase
MEIVPNDMGAEGVDDSAKRLLWVIGAGGAPFEYVLPKLLERSEVYALVATRIPPKYEDMVKQHCAGVVAFDREDQAGDFTLAIVESARRFGVDGIVTFSELCVIGVAEACLQLGLPGPGPNANLARDKWLMRQCWAQAGLPVPRFVKVDNLQDLEAAARTLTLPILLKPSGRGGGIGQQVIDESTFLPDVMKRVEVELEQAAQRGIVEYSGGLDVAHCVAEEIIDSTTESWYDDDRYGDYLSVEGIVARGVYHPICITARLPTLPGYAETVALSPCTLTEELQRKIEQVARDAVNAIGLETCATHTELKLMSGQRLCLLETAARTAGSTATAIAESVFGIDMVGLYTSEALGLPQEYPEQMLVEGRGARATLYLFGADPAGNPWASELPFPWKSLDWSQLISPASQVEIIPSQMVPDGTVVRPYQVGLGALNNFGSLVLRSPDPETLLNDSYRLVDRLEAVLRAMSESDRERSAG